MSGSSDSQDELLALVEKNSIESGLSSQKLTEVKRTYVAFRSIS